ncbi:hypothetical protein EW026_g1828 [Hermanssonia centrifuga]|uniref:GH16 domain-containing protein n=1 Tax=Hermanssonia centrifuga TaxID=98765 RepID=A0A4S4KR33_9APHY|nr:hypothetical protein EW026_g1828 [Hermanssonia centrifuga]
MRTGYAYLFICFTSVLMHLSAGSAHFVLKDKYEGSDFYSGWRWETDNDPTHGRVNYVDQATAIAHNYTFATDSKFVMRADYENAVPPYARGRDSVRISSYDAYDESVIVLDVQHMPEGCSTWPAFWTLSQKGPWPQGGEIDIVEGVNQAAQNLASLHTTPNCVMPQQRFQTGTTVSTNCDAHANFNQGCGTDFTKGASYGSYFNARGGGFFVMARSRNEGIRVWFWQRDDPAVPDEVRQSGSAYGVPGAPQLFPGFGGPPTIHPDATWGTPDADFPVGDGCIYEDHFDAHMMVFDLTFCGDWAGADYPNSPGCSGDCVDFVNNNPDEFTEAYWEINSLRVYTVPLQPI